MSDFKEFQKEIKALGAPWNTDDVYFNQERDGYAASYKPMYHVSYGGNSDEYKD